MSSSEDGESSTSTWAEEGLDLIRAFSGGMLFGVPLFYTMEVWWIGSHTTPTQMLFILGLIFLALLVLNRTGGFRFDKETRWSDVIQDSIEALAIGLCATVVVLTLLRQTSLGMPIDLFLGRVLNESIPFCLGVGVARSLLGQDDDSEGDSGDDPDDGGDGKSDTQNKDDDEPITGLWESLKNSRGDFGAAALGAIFIGLSIAPTEEVPMLASAMDPTWQAVVVVASLAISYLIVFVAGFSGENGRHDQRGLFQHPATETMVTYLIALGVSILLLWIFQKGLGPWNDLLARTVVLGLPATVGGAVGRLAI